MKLGVLSLESFGLQSDEIDIEDIDLKVLKIAQSAVNIVDDDSVKACGRSSRSSGTGGVIEHQMLEQPIRLKFTRQRPEKFKNLSLSTAAIAEIFINRSADFSSIARLADFKPLLNMWVKCLKLGLQGLRACKVSEPARSQSLQGLRTCKVSDPAKSRSLQGLRACKASEHARPQSLQGHRQSLVARPQPEPASSQSLQGLRACNLLHIELLFTSFP